VAIRSSASHEVRRLLADLEAGDTVRREAALARLAVIGTRALRQILESLAAAPRGAARIPLLRALEVVPDPRSVEPVLASLNSPEPAERVAAMNAARALLPLSQATPLLDWLTGCVLDAARPLSERISALQALSSLPARTVRPILEQLRDDPAPTMREAALGTEGPADDPVADIEEAADGWLPRDPHILLQMLSRAPADVPLSTLHRLVEKVRSREADGRPRLQRDWSAVRGALHLSLARRGSKVALYDLRETIEEAREPLALDYLSAIALIGDATCVEPLAVAYLQAQQMADAEGWRRRIAEAFRQVVAQEHLTRRHAVIRRVRARLRDSIDELLEGVRLKAEGRGGFQP
jgi:hypothetical protein